MRSILVVGVGGQGTLTASRVFGKVAELLGLDVKLSEVHGMAQRGGSVVTHVRMGESIASPIIDKGGADIIIAFELMEAARYISYLKPEGKMFVNTQRILPLPVVTGVAEYSSDLGRFIMSACAQTQMIDAAAIAREAGSIKTVNTVLLGFAASGMDIPKDVFVQALKSIIKPKLLDMNLAAFERGYKGEQYVLE